ncbi:DeoR/GlpR family DNA-binding transcription regulator [Salirhabdus sp. Marseille-P4669]|uniref:DeoR/GlpR family DNA-binding transcription regulator n=1 Tax=Salirhabdus sp. Marseille-P4669 TaxID=2042310 RepID=UPI000C7B282F|nr:DeoR/GlpR family DNA-binding transcription regulator [Salirhabdus sp. Marseille-P4669]
MHPTKRRDWVLRVLQTDGKVEINSLSEELDVSPMTIRRDLDQLEEEGLVIRVHGGAILAKPLITETPFSAKEGRQTEQKRQIAKKTLSLIKDGQTILLDSGTTTLEIARLLKTRNNLTVITNDIKIAAELLESNLKVIVTGGELQKDVGALFGPQAHMFLKDINVDVFFLGAHAIDVQAGITSPTFEKSLMKQVMIESADSTWLVADSSKLNQKAFSKVCGFDRISGFITDDDIPSENKEKFSEYIRFL